MFQNSIIVFNRILIMGLLMIVGYIIYHKGVLDNHTTKKLSLLLNTYVMPCCVITAFQRPFDAGLAKTLAGTFVMAMVVFGISIALALLIFPKTKPDSRVCIVLTNNGFMALPLLDAMFGSMGVFLGSAHIVAMAIMIWTFAVSQLDKNYKFSLKRILMTPGVIAAALSIALFVSPIKLPEPIYVAASFMGDLNTPLGMLVLGAYLAQIDFRLVFADKAVWKPSLLRLILIPAISVVLLTVIPLDQTAKLALLVGVATPTAIASAMFAQIYDTDYLFSTRVVALTTLLSLLTLPGWIAVLTAILSRF